MYDTSHLEALLAQQEEEWKSRDFARRKKSDAPKSSQSDGKENDGFKDTFDEEEENPLELSAHASADESEDSSSSHSERSFSSDDESNTNNLFPSKRRHIRQKSKKNSKYTDSKTGSPHGNTPPTSQSIEDGDSVVTNFLPRLGANSQQLATTARLLRDRFAAFFSAQIPSSSQHHQATLSNSNKPFASEIKGAAKLMRRLDKEVQMAEEAAAKDEALRLLKLADTGEEREGHLEDGRQPYVRCNSLVFFEILLACLENEKDVVAVVEVEQFKDNADASNTSSGNNGGGGGALPAWARMSVEIDVISQKGARWFRLKGTSLKNLEADFLGNSDRKPFVSTAKNFVRAAKNHLLPYGRHPSTVIVISELPEKEEEEEGGELEHPRLKTIRESVYDALCRDAGVDIVIPYYNRALISEVAAEIDLYGTDVCAANATRWATSLLPEAVEARLAAHRRLWALRSVPRALKPRFCHSLLPSAAPLASVPRLVNFDVTALVAVCSDTCHEFDLSAAYTLDSYAVLRRQVWDEERTQTLDEHAYPLLDSLTVEGAPRWWRENWGRSAPDPLSGKLTLCIASEDGDNGESDRIDREEAGATNEVVATVVAASCGAHSSMPKYLQFKYPFTHDQLVAYIDGIAAEAWRAKKSLLRTTKNGGGEQKLMKEVEEVEGGKEREVKEDDNEDDNDEREGPPKPSDRLWTPEQHAEERRKDEVFPHRLNWIMTDVALAEFSWILKTIAGTMELPRAEWLLKHIHVIPSEAFVHVELDPIFSLDAETPSERKERRRNDDKMQRKLFQERQAEAKRKREEERAREAAVAAAHFNNKLALFGDVEKLPKGVNRTSIKALEAAARSELLELEINNNTNNEGGGGQSSSDSSSTPLSKGEPSNDNKPLPSTESSSSEGRSTLFDILPSHVHLLECTGKIKSRHKAVFGVGDALRATTLTANEQFLKAALEQQIRLDVVVHHSRALVGKKVSAGLLLAKAKTEEAYNAM